MDFNVVYHFHFYFADKFDLAVCYIKFFDVNGNASTFEPPTTAPPTIVTVSQAPLSPGTKTLTLSLFTRTASLCNNRTSLRKLKRRQLLLEEMNVFRKIMFTSFESFLRVYNKRDDFGFPIVDFPWLSGDVPRLPSYGVYISQLVRFARCCTRVLDFNSKNLQLTSKLLTQGNKYHKLQKTFGKFFKHTLTCCLNLVKYRFNSMLRKE